MGVKYPEKKNDLFNTCYVIECAVNTKPPPFLLQKERDLELAARIGQSLLKKNKALSEKNELLEEQVEHIREEVCVCVCGSVSDVTVLGKCLQLLVVQVMDHL